MSRLYIVCVVYNILINEIAALNNFKRASSKHDDIRIIIMDNSDNDNIKNYNTHISINDSEITYISNNGNIGISKSFNLAASLIDDDDAWIMFSDDDTDISLDYLYNLHNTISSTHADIVSGIVCSGNKIMSPLKSIKLFNRKDNFICCSGEYSNIYCINSCLCIKRKVFNEVKYNEDIFLDLADFMFMDELIEKQINRIVIIDGKIVQSFSGDSRTNLKNAIKRYRIYRKDFVTYCKATEKSFLFMLAMLFKHGIKTLLSSKLF